MSGEACACGHDETDHGAVIVGCIHCRNCDRYIPRSTYEPERRSVAASQMECDVAEVLHAHDSVTWADALDLSAALLCGPLAPLLAKLGAGLALADELAYYASKTTGGTWADGASEAADRLRAALAPLAGQHTTDEEADRG